ncbi:hypothetical protein [Flexibacterium corallicola]|uniref:hypothetical protein n=1 Tax=Flexibacterium corallicola TaxID=3037259 RepID=UPI00286F612B|nr:hypothetical protein [Pseudovibrio sp. M1P-2-3]
MDQVIRKDEAGLETHGPFSEAELSLLNYQMEENEFASLIRLVTSLPSEKWSAAKEAIKKAAGAS